jgi:hypothetical protein
MTMALFSLAEASIAQAEARDGAKKAPPKRTATAVADRQLAPEPR